VLIDCDEFGNVYKTCLGGCDSVIIDFLENYSRNARAFFKKGRGNMNASNNRGYSAVVGAKRAISNDNYRWEYNNSNNNNNNDQRELDIGGASYNHYKNTNSQMQYANMHNNNENRNNNSNFDLSTVQCYKCGAKGHFANKCHQLQN